MTITDGVMQGVRDFLHHFSGPMIWLTAGLFVLVTAATVYQAYRLVRRGPLSVTRRAQLEQWAKRLTHARWIGFAVVLLLGMGLSYHGHSQAGLALLLAWVAVTFLLRGAASVLRLWAIEKLPE